MPYSTESAYTGIDGMEFSIELLSLDDLPPGQKDTLDYWRSITPAGTIGPPWKSFDLLQLPPETLPALLVVDCVPGEDRVDYRYRYWGSALTPVFGQDLTGKLFSECAPAFRDLGYRTYDETYRLKAPCVIRFNARIGDKETPFQTALRLPLSDDGTSVTSIISMVILAYRKHEWENLWNT